MRAHWLATVAASMTALVACLGASAVSVPDPTEVLTKSGPVTGSAIDGVVSYEGIPFAAPPVGALRWRPPAPALPWTVPLAATDYGATCLQNGPPANVPPDSRAATESEDCLTLNLWTPQQRTGKLPVMVWVYGGGNATGESAQSYYAGRAFSRDGVVLVSFNYRVGLFGFFAHAALAPESAGGALANYGLMDQIAALRWVRDNIAAFGGDPANVTLFGESSGAGDALVLDASARARGLFEREIAESPGGITDPPRTLAQQQAADAAIVRTLGVADEHPTAARLRAIPASALASAKYDYDDVQPVVDGTVLEDAPLRVLARHPGVPLLLGTNDGESSLIGDEADPHDLFPLLSPSALAALRTAYAARGVTDDRALTQQMFVDGYFGAPVRRVATAVRTGGVAAYVYKFSYILSLFRGVRANARHGSEIPYVFETFRSEASLTDTDRMVESAMHGCWIAFARTGVPACSALPAWPPYDPHDGRVMLVGAQPAYGDPGTNALLDLFDRSSGRLMPLQNRVTPAGQIVATDARGLLMGNRGSLHDGERRIRRPWQGRRWIACALEFKGRHREMMEPGKYTHLFFLDEATAYSAGHRPCAECRYADYRRFRDRWREAIGPARLVDEIDVVLHAARLDGRAKRTHRAHLEDLPDGTIVLHDGRPWLVWEKRLHGWTAGGYAGAAHWPDSAIVDVLTPAPFVRVFATGLRPLVHPSVG